MKTFQIALAQMFLRLVLILLSVAFMFMPAAMAGNDGIQNQEAPIRLVLGEFYKSYHTQFSKSQEPSSDFLAKSVSIKLIEKIEKIKNSEDGQDADYFLKAQDYLDDWKENIAVTQIKVVGNMAKAVVSLGLEGTAQQISVNLILNNHQWKISEVRSLKPR